MARIAWGEDLPGRSGDHREKRSINMEVVTRLATADASTLLREGLKRLLGDANDLLVVGLAANDVARN